VPPPTLPPPATATASAAVPGTYAQSGACLTQTATGQTPPFNLYNPRLTPIAGLYVVCVPSVVVRPTLELQVNATWLFTRDGMSPELANALDTDTAVLPGYDGSAITLLDNLGRQANHTALEGAPRDGASGLPGSVFSGYYLFPPAQAGATSFTLVDGQRRLTIGNLTLAVLAP
jgi:hypothetical protein